MKLWLTALALSVALAACIPARHGPVVARPAAVPVTGGTSMIGTPGNPPFYKVFGQRYYVLPSAAGYSKRGVASWYGAKFHGRNTSNGEVFDMYQPSAAHKTLPIPCWVRVTNLRNGSSIDVRVNDRGPFVKNRLIDLSWEAARQLDMINDGTTLVEVEVIPEPVQSAQDNSIQTIEASSITPTAAAVAAAAEALPATIVDKNPTDVTPQRDPGQIFVQVGAFGELTNAQRLQTTLYNAAMENVRLSSIQNADGAIHRVQIGPLTGVDEYDALVGRLESLGINETHLITE